MTIKKRRRRIGYRVIQEHHLSYNPPKICLIFRSEHTVITKLNRLLKSKPSESFIMALASCLSDLASVISYSPEEMGRLRRENLKKKADKKKQRKLKVRRKRNEDA